MRIGLAQTNATLGDFTGNRKKILTMIKRALQRRCDLVVFPEAALFGYHPMDLLERPEVVENQLKELKILSEKIPDKIAVLVGAITINPAQKGKPYLNAAVLLQKGKRPKVFAKQLLPTYDVFDEGRHIEPGDTSKNILRFKGQNILVTICEDIWAWPKKRGPSYARYGVNPLKSIPSESVDIVVNLSASPFTDVKLEARRATTLATARHFDAPLVYVNMVGAQDELIFDGGSFCITSNNKIISQCVRFQEDLNVVDLETNEGGLRELPSDVNELRRQAIVLGIKDYTSKTGFQKVHLGLSGGIDSALVACLAVDAMGSDNVVCLALPTRFNTEESLNLAKELCKNLNVRLIEIPIDDVYRNTLSEFEKATGHKEFDVVNENIQARIRGTLLMAYSNQVNSLLLAASNKSEIAMGYSTLYGDMCGGLMPIGDLLKTEVYELARYYNLESELIPERIINRPPSAELAPNQKDEDTLPPYKKLDPVVEKFVEGLSEARGSLEKRVLRALMRSEFKRWQSPPILKVSEHAFGMGRRLPIAHKALQ